LRDHCQAGINADAHLRPHAEFSLNGWGGSRETLVNKQRGAAGAQRCIFQRFRSTEQRHYAIAGEVLDRAALLLNRACHKFVDRLNQGVGAFFAEAFGNRCKADHVREKDGHLPSFA
jgi:hypothetical protein